jgi:hypothetical protein
MLGALPFLVDEEAAGHGERGDEVDVAAARARPAHHHIGGQYGPKGRLGPRPGIEDAGDDRQGRRFRHAERETMVDMIL